MLFQIPFALLIIVNEAIAWTEVVLTASMVSIYREHIVYSVPHRARSAQDLLHVLTASKEDTDLNVNTHA